MKEDLSSYARLRADSTLPNFMRVNLYTSLGALKTGMDILLKKENVKLDRMMGHGGLFKTKGVGQTDPCRSH